eukprot:scaffold1107_cov185-Pinguiococcus_pyrenoidosus.AAC.3
MLPQVGAHQWLSANTRGAASDAGVDAETKLVVSVRIVPSTSGLRRGCLTQLRRRGSGVGCAG